MNILTSEDLILKVVLTNQYSPNLKALGEKTTKSKPNLITTSSETIEPKRKKIWSINYVERSERPKIRVCSTDYLDGSERLGKRAKREALKEFLVDQ